ncbi:membrane protein [Corynebacterium renale]|uniref:Acyltransferase-like protein n=1 Tax=Corynebacterium renale TaxID=1724 RepID=A0A2A9DPA0_9CORY|nr:acyltransferase-like protein [Corynebacterium renale]SQI22067.1 membrane protein [Corynebacterium renale]
MKIFVNSTVWDLQCVLVSEKTGSHRVIAIDVARAIALIGMVVAHLYPFPGLAGEFFKGFPAALFAVLSGVSLYFMRKHSRQSVALRGAIIAVLGLAIAPWAGPISVVLPAIGVGYILFGLLRVTGWSDRALAITLVALVVASGITRVIALQTTLPAMLREPYPLPGWLAYMLVGVLAGRLLLHNPQRQKMALWGFPVAAVGIAARGWVDSQYAVATRNQAGIVVQGFVDAKPHSGGLIDLVATMAGSLAVIGVCVLVVKRGEWLFPLQAMGSMTLTIYTAHVLSVGLLNGASTQQLYPIFTIVTLVAALAGATLWRSFFARGPLEAAVSAICRKV